MNLPKLNKANSSYWNQDIKPQKKELIIVKERRNYRTLSTDSVTKKLFHLGIALYHKYGGGISYHVNHFEKKVMCL